MESQNLTELEFWEAYWKNNKNDVVEVKHSPKKLFLNEILNVFDKYLPPKAQSSILEIGGAPGQYLMYIQKKFGYAVSSLDYSEIGNKQTYLNYERAGIPITLYNRNLFGDNTDLPKFDIVYSLGLIEHFDDPMPSIKKHLELLKPGGILVLGVPNLTGIYSFFLKKLSPTFNVTHNLNTMNIDNWDVIEKENNVKKIFCNYVGGFEPLLMKKNHGNGVLSHFYLFIVKVLMVVFSFNFPFLRRYNSKKWSGYLMGVYQKN